MPESLRNENRAEVNGRIGVASIHRRLDDVSLSANLSEGWHDVYSAGRGECCYLCRTDCRREQRLQQERKCKDSSRNVRLRSARQHSSRQPGKSNYRCA
jgi:hypothetical protein